MRRIRRAVTAVLAVAVLPAGAWAQNPQTGDNPVQVPKDNTSFGGSSAEFLEFGSSARGMALGPAFASSVNDVNSLHYNPAGLTEMEGPQAQVTVMPYIADTNYYWGGIALPLADGDFGFGAFIARFGFGNSPVFTAEDPEGLSGQTFGADEVVAGASFAHAFIDRFSAGFTFKFINDNLATGSLGGAIARTVAIDFGTNFHTSFAGRPIRLAFVVQNLGGDLRHSGDALRFRAFTPNGNGLDQRFDKPPAEVKTSNFPLPRLFRVGLSYDPVSAGPNRLTLMGEFVESNNQASTGGFAAEYTFESPDVPIGLSARGSWQLQPDERVLGDNLLPSDRALDGVNVGAGLSYRVSGRYKANLDYTYRHLGVLGNVDVVSFSFGWAQ